MLNKNHRWIRYYDLRLHPSPPTSPAIKISTFIQPLRDYFLSGNARQFIRADTAACRIADFRHDEGRNILVLLLQFADKNIGNPAYSDLPTGEIRIGERREEEGIAVSAHVMLSLTETELDSESYLCLLEQVPGLNRTQVGRFLTHQFMEISDIINLTYEDTSGRVTRQRPRAELYPYPSTSLREAMRTGHLKEFVFVKNVPVNQDMDELAYVDEQVQQITFKIGKEQTFASRLAAITNLSVFAKEQHGRNIRIKYRDVDENSDHTATITAAQEGEAENSLLEKRDLVRLEDTLNDCEVRIHDGIIERMFSLLSAMRN